MVQTHCLSLLGVQGAHSPQAFPFTVAEAPGPWHSPFSILIPFSITSRDLHGVPAESPDFPAFHFLPLPFVSHFTAISSIQLSVPRLSFKVGQSQKSCPRHCLRTWSLQGKAHNTHRPCCIPGAELLGKPSSESCVFIRLWKKLRDPTGTFKS